MNIINKHTQAIVYNVKDRRLDGERYYASNREDGVILFYDARTWRPADTINLYNRHTKLTERRTVTLEHYKEIQLVSGYKAWIDMKYRRDSYDHELSRYTGRKCYLEEDGWLKRPADGV